MRWLYLWTMRSGYVSTGENRLHYLAFGTGKRLLIAFHGYSNNASLFQPFESFLGTEYTIVSIDLPYHGRSAWPPQTPLHLADLRTLINNLCEQFGVNKFSLLGFSLGGRVSLFILEHLPERIESVLLAAPDGLAFNPLYYFVTRTYLGRRLFSSVLTKPERYFKLIDKLHERRFLDPSRYKFVTQYLQSRPARTFLGNVWPNLGNLIPNARKVKQAAAKYHIPLHIFMGRYDKIIPLKQAEVFSKGAPGVQLHILEKGHRLFDSGSVREMAQCLLPKQ